MNTPTPCDDCGACCRTLIIEIEHLDVVREPRLLAVVQPCKGWDDGAKSAEDPWDRQYILAIGTATRGCPMHEGGRCGIHPTRPNTCVGFEAGMPDCQRARYYDGKLPLGRDAWPADEAELAAFIGEDY